MIKTLIFDLGKVIINFDHSRIVRRIEQHCQFNEVEIYQKILTTSATRSYEIGTISSNEFFEQIKQSLDLRMNFAQFSEVWNSTFDLETILSETFIKRLSEKYRLLILSDTNDLHFEFIKQNFPILQYFDDCLLSYRVGAVKPTPEIFLAALEKANCRPEECFFTDDRESNVHGAQKVGIKTVQFISAEQLEKVISDL
jgi:glucose-1-phosphatase